MTSTPVSPVAARYLGQSVTRKEDQRLLTGHGLYVDDVKVSGTLHAAFLRSDLARAAISRVDTSAAKEMPGVVAVYTWEDFNGITGPGYHAMLGEELVVPPPLAITDVRYVGDPVAVVIADTRYLAEDACEAIEVDYEPRQAVVDYMTASADTENIVHAGWGLESNAMAAVPFMPLSPDLDDAFASAAHVVECDVVQNRYVAMPMETRGILVSYHAGRQELDIVCATQSVHETRNFFSRYLQIPDGNVRVTARDVGGGFGQKMFVYREECAVALASFLLGRPVKWIEDRRENLLSAGHSRNEYAHVRMAVDDEGIIQAITVDAKADVGAYAVCPAAIDPMLVPGPYKIPRYGFAMEMSWTNTMGKAAYRGPWMFETTAREVAMDHVASEIGLDPAELRRRNLLAASDLPFTAPTGNVFQEITPLETLEQALEILDYEAFRKEQAAALAEGRYLGVGICAYVEPTSMGGNTLATEAATVKVDTSGRVMAYLGTTSHGQSIETTMAQIVAEHLGVSYDDVTIVQADSQSTPYGPGTGGSRTAVVAGGAAREATVAVREKVLAVAAHMMEAAPDDLEIADSVVSVRGTPSKSVTMKDVAKAALTDAHELPGEIGAGLEATVRFRPKQFPTWSNATHVCVVEIDAESWIPEVQRYIVSEDCGKMINPMIVEGQIFGGVVQGMGGVLLEDFVYDEDGNPLTTTFMDYLPPDHLGGPGDRGRPHRDRVDHQPRRVQGHGRGWRHRRARGGRQRGRRRPPPARREGHEDAARARADLRPRRGGESGRVLSIAVEHDGAVTTVTLDRPERLNALDLEHVVALRDTLRALADDATVRVVVLTGAGRGFSAGGDVTAMAGDAGGGGDDAAPLDLRSIMEISELLHTMPAITVAAVNGPCAGAGLSFACACDLRYAARSAVFVTAFLRVGSSGDHGQRVGAHPGRRAGQGTRAAVARRARRRRGGAAHRARELGLRRRRRFATTSTRSPPAWRRCHPPRRGS